MFSADAVSTAINFKTITMTYSGSALVVSLVLLLCLLAAYFYFVKNCLMFLQCIEINCVFACTILFEMLYIVFGLLIPSANFYKVKERSK